MGRPPLNAQIIRLAQSHRHGSAAYEGIDCAIHRTPRRMSLDAEVCETLQLLLRAELSQGTTAFIR